MKTDCYFFFNLHVCLFSVLYNISVNKNVLLLREKKFFYSENMKFKYTESYHMRQLLNEHDGLIKETLSSSLIYISLRDRHC